MSFVSRSSAVAFVVVAFSGLGRLAEAADITLFDKVTQYRSNSGSKEWWGDNSNAAGVQHPDVRGIAEDNESEPGTAIGQLWDLEAFRLDGMTLSVIGGFNFMTGEGTYASGDIFIDVDGDASYGTDLGGGGTQAKSNSLFRYDYVIDFEQTLNASFDSTTSAIGTKYTVRKLDENASVVVSVAVNANAESNPWIYRSGGTVVAGYENLPLTMGSYLGGEYMGFNGDNTHHMLQFDLGFLGPEVPYGTLFKFTMECGNDNLVGRKVPDAGLTVGLLGIGLAALGGIHRYRRLHAGTLPDEEAAS